jgi:hypothetical protein
LILTLSILPSLHTHIGKEFRQLFADGPASPRFTISPNSGGIIAFTRRTPGERNLRFNDGTLSGLHVALLTRTASFPAGLLDRGFFCRRAMGEAARFYR